MHAMRCDAMRWLMSPSFVCIYHQSVRLSTCLLLSTYLCGWSGGTDGWFVCLSYITTSTTQLLTPKTKTRCLYCDHMREGGPCKK